MMKKVIAIAFVAIIVFSLCACSGGKSALVGTWVSNEQKDSSSSYYKVTYDLYSSGTGDFSAVLTRPNGFSKREGEVYFGGSFTWKIKSGDVIIQETHGGEYTFTETFSFDGKTLIKRSDSGYVMHKEN